MEEEGEGEEEGGQEGHLAVCDGGFGPLGTIFKCTACRGLPRHT